MKDILGLDISTEKISYVLLSDTQINKYGEVFSPLRGPKGGVIKNPLAMLKSFESLLLELKPQIVYIEGLAWIKNRSSFISIAKVLGGLEFVCFSNDVEFVVVEGRVWKSALLMRGNAQKEEIKEWVILEGKASEQIGKEDPFESQDLYDAYCIARYGNSKEQK